VRTLRYGDSTLLSLARRDSTCVMASISALPRASFLRRVSATYVTFVVANALSNFVLFPGQRLDYGAANALLGRPVGCA
jgi:hypothetical protein